MRGGENVADSSVEALHHTVRLWMARLDWVASGHQAMFDLEQRTLAVKRMLVRRRFCLAGGAIAGGEPIRELTTVVGQQIFYFHRGCAV